MTHLSNLLQTIIQAFQNGQLPQLGFWTYIIVAVWVASQGPIGTLVGASAAAMGLMRPEGVFIAGMIGNAVGDSFWYLMGYLGKIDWLLRFGKKLGIRPDVLEKFENEMRHNTPRIMFVSVVTLSMIVPALVSAGLVKAPWKRWFPAAVAGELLWTGSMLLVGFYATEAIKRVEQTIEYVALGGTVVFVIFLILYGRRIYKKNYQN
jgi:membrane protein DedA with SNARE-associated domain